MRPPLAAGRLVVVDEETLAFALKTPWSDGTTHLLLSPQELIEKQPALVPPRGSTWCAITACWRRMRRTDRGSCRGRQQGRMRRKTALATPVPPRGATGCRGRNCWRASFASM